MNVGQLIGYLKDYDEDEEVEVEVRFGEAGESRASTFDVTLLSRGEVGGGDESPWPTIGANVGLGTTAGAGLDPLARHARGIDRRLGYHRGGARSAPRVRDLDHTPCHAAGLAIERVSVQDSHRSPDDIFELRTILGNNIVRILYFFDEGETIIATNGFIKKQQKTPRSEILLAKQRRTIYLKRKGSRR